MFAVHVGPGAYDVTGKTKENTPFATPYATPCGATPFSSGKLSTYFLVGLNTPSYGCNQSRSDQSHKLFSSSINSCIRKAFGSWEASSIGQAAWLKWYKKALMNGL